MLPHLFRGRLKLGDRGIFLILLSLVRYPTLGKVLWLPITINKKAQKSLLSFTNACASLHHVVLEQSLSFFLAGIRSWDVDLKCCDLDQQLQLFITRHSAHFSSEVRAPVFKVNI
uniref:Microtubule-associated protein 1B/S N-terminal domain-containing protein n=1 Tax=Astatotilapia calliptera TaxID=8154 RepID=A0AAX7V3I5_ASTCA